MHVAYLIHQFAPEVGAGAARVTEMAAHWMSMGGRVTVITGMPNRPVGRIYPEYRGRLFLEEDWEGIRVLRSWLYASPKHGFVRTVVNNATFSASTAAHALARLGRPDVLIASAPPFFPQVSGWATARLLRVPLVLEMRDLWPDYLVDMNVLSERSLPARGLFAAERSLIRAGQWSVVVTESFRRRVIAKGGVPERISVIPNGVDLTSYYPADEPPPVPGMERDDERPIVGYLGNIGAGQDIPTIVRAADQLRRENVSIRFVVAGDGPERRRSEHLAQELGLDNLVLHPPIPKEQTRAFYNACDICLVPLADVPVFQETVPSKIFEVMACERPVLASVGGEAASIVRSSEAGLVVRPGDPADIAHGIRTLLSVTAVERAGMGRRGRLHVAGRYERGLLAEEYWDLLQRVVRGTPESVAAGSEGV